MSDRGRRRRVVQPPLTGTSTRMKNLPHRDISSMEFHSAKYESRLTEALSVSDNANALEVPNRDKQTSRKCVYTYEDKYTFARILTADSLVFDSHFESGNLHSAFRIFPSHSSTLDTSKQVYDLYMHPDVHTSGHTQWFYFSAANTKVGQEVVFNLRNFAKPDSMFNKGMQPLVFSRLSNKKGWRRCGHDITYFGPIANNNFAEDAKKKRKKGQPAPGLYTMTFCHIFNKTDDTVYFAFCHPYTYTNLQKYLLLLGRRKALRGLQYRRTTLCRTLAGNLCDVLTITAPALTQEELTGRVLAVVTCRVHPGETNASWMLQGLLDFISADTRDAKLLRSIYVFKIVPMLNPDGVVNGNYRTSLSGSDLNRRWCRPDRVMHPTIHHTKQMIRRLKEIYPQCIIMDLHGHSTKEGIFVYGCVPDRRHLRPTSPRRSTSDSDLEGSGAVLEIGGIPGLRSSSSSSGSQQKLIPKPKPPPNMHVEGTGFTHEDNGIMVPSRVVEPLPPMLPRAASPAPPMPGDAMPEYVRATTLMKREFLEWKVKLFPRLLANISDMFLFDGCSFKVHRSKASTMRIVNFIELGVDCVYTIEASLAGLQPNHFGAHDLTRFGSHICRGLLEAYPMLAPRNSKYLVSGALNWKSGVDVLMHANPAGLTLKEEFEKFRNMSVYDEKGVGVSLMSESGVQEMTAAAVVGEGRDDDDSDIDDVDEPRQADDKDSSGKSFKKKSSSKLSKPRAGTKAAAKATKDAVSDKAEASVYTPSDAPVKSTKPKKKDKDKAGSSKAGKDKEREKVKVKDIEIPVTYKLIEASFAPPMPTVSAASVTAELRRPPVVPKPSAKSRRRSNLAAAVDIYSGNAPASPKPLRKSWDDVAALVRTHTSGDSRAVEDRATAWSGIPSTITDDLLALNLDDSTDTFLPPYGTGGDGCGDGGENGDETLARSTLVQVQEAGGVPGPSPSCDGHEDSLSRPLDVASEQDNARRVRSLARLAPGQRSASPGGSVMASAGAESLRGPGGGPRLSLGIAQTPTLVPPSGLAHGVHVRSMVHPNSAEVRVPTAMSADMLDVRSQKKLDDRQISMPSPTIAGKSLFGSMIEPHKVDARGDRVKKGT